jgi:putative copper export protein
MLAVAIFGFALASDNRRVGWPLAAIGVVAGALRNAFFGQWTRLVNPIHVLSAGLWIGTLFVLAVAGFRVVMRSEPAGDRRASVVADMVNRFSPLALTAGCVVVIFGVITAWRHLHHLAALWTTPYGYALIAKLCAVAVVFALGAWNWRRVRPTLGTMDGASVIRRSATKELIVAGLVLAITAILVSLPSPKGP